MMRLNFGRKKTPTGEVAKKTGDLLQDAVVDAAMRQPDADVAVRLPLNLIRINLLPHRELKRAARQKQLVFLAVSSAILAVLIIVLVHGIIGAKIDSQNARNTYLESETAKLDKQIEEIKKLKEQIQAMLSRKKVVETLQSDRSQSVYLLDQMVRLLPDGVYLKAFKQTGASVNIQGYAQSNARVATFIRNMENSKPLVTPELIETKAATVDKNRLNEFSLNVKMAPTAQAEDDKQKKGGAKSANAKSNSKDSPQ
ncbi:MAG: PilN domain-containing protein [Sulfuricellaceae bacterium]